MSYSRSIKVTLLIIILIAAILRLYKLDQVPVSLNWDEAAAGYNAYTIAHWGRDEWGKAFPLVFTSFYDDKHPSHIYITSVFVRLFGLSDFTTRLPGAIAGILSVLVIFYLARILFKSNLTALLSALFLAVSPYHIQFSRGLWESNFALFFFLLGLLLFFLSFQNRGKLLNLAFLSFGLSIFSYHSSKIVVPMVVLLLVILYFKDLRKLSWNFFSGLFIFSVFIALLFVDTRLLGTARVKQTQFSQDNVEKTQIFQKTNNSLLGLGEITLRQYVTHFTPQYLFISGDQYPRNSVKVIGEFYKIDALFILVGLFYLLMMRSKVSILVLAWLLLAPIPSSLVQGAPSANRAIFMVGSLHLLSALGVSVIVRLFKQRLRIYILIIILLAASLQVYSYINYYFTVYPLKDPHEWQYGMKQIVEFVNLHPEYDQVYVTDIRSQPYIFFLFYLKTPLPEFLNTMVYNRGEIKKTSVVAYFDKYYFGGWDPIESMPSPGVLYVLSPDQYDGLRQRSDFSVKKVIRFPDGGDDFFLVSTK